MAHSGEIHPGAHVTSCEQAVSQTVVSSLRNPLIEVVEVVVVKCETHGQSADDECRQLCARTSPLLLGVAFYQLFVDVAAYQRKGLLLKVAGLGDAILFHLPAGIGPLLLQPGKHFGGSAHAPYLIECVHVERQVVQTAVGGGGHRRVCVAVERHDGVDKLPNLPVGCVEYVRAVFVHVYPFDRLAVEVASGVCATVDYQTSPAGIGGQTGECGSEQSGAHYEVVVFLHA